MNSDKNKTLPVLPGSMARCLHIMLLTQLIIAWPLYDLLSKYPGFFVARNAQPADVALLLLTLSLALPLLLIGLQAPTFRIGPRFGATVYALVIYVLLLFLGHLILHNFESVGHQTIWAAILALVLLLIYVFSQVGKLFMSSLSPAIVIVPVLFILNDAIKPLLWPVQAAPVESSVSTGELPPILFVVFDEFPSNALLDTNGLIDAKRYPNLSELSQNANWYPNATTVATSTILAIPAIVTGRYPDTYRMPHQGEYPDNLFTWLAADYDLNVHEAVSALCPANLCSAKRMLPIKQRWQSMILDVSAIYLNITASQLFPDLPAINQSWEGFWGSAVQNGGMYEHRVQQLGAFLDKVQSTQKPSLDFMHVNFPHIPYEYLPSGKRYNDGWLMPGIDFTTNTWTGSERQSRQAYERFQMQASTADNWLGQLLEKLKNEDLYERSLIILTSDHGVSFEPGSGRRDAPPDDNLDTNILPVPLIIKVPFQEQGHKDPRNAEVIDILPTVAQVMNRQLPWEADGASLLGDPKEPNKRAVHEGNSMTLFLSSADRVRKALSSAWMNRDWMEPRKDLIGKPLSRFEPGLDLAMRVTLNNADFFGNVNPDDDFLPAHANGEIIWPGHADADLAFALNGTIVAVSTAYADKSKWLFSAMLPETGFRAGNNVIEVLGITDSGQETGLVRGANSPYQSEYTWDVGAANVFDNRGALTTDRDGIEGHIDYISRGTNSIEVSGWGIDAAQSRPLEAILIFDEDELVWQGKTHMLREETHQYGVVIEVGFLAVLPHARIKDRRGSSLRAYAVSDDRRVQEIQIKQ
ncbi:MAG: sulfatase-like hydrolase/transferase [Gammaproteobacteria bacterium]|nr:sulfatase-like hydrolase/transferase [Gammaproteobacteria bacterium]